MSYKAVDTFLPTSKFVLDWFVANKMIEKPDNTVISDDDIFFVDVDSNIIIFRRGDMGFDTQTLILALMMKLLFKLDVCPDVKDLKNAKM